MLSSLKAFFSTIKLQVVDCWNRSKIFILALVALVLTLEFQKIKDSIIIYLSQKEIKSSDEIDEKLAAKENMETTQANQLEQQAANETATDDWYKK